MESESNVAEHRAAAACPTCGKEKMFEHPNGQLRHCFSCGEIITSKPPMDVDAVADSILRASHRHLLVSSEARRHLVEERGLHPQVLTDSAIGVIPADLDVSQLFMSPLKAAETELQRVIELPRNPGRPSKEERSAILLAASRVEELKKAREALLALEQHAGRVAFFYTNAGHRVVRIRVEQPDSGQAVEIQLKPQGGLFNHSLFAPGADGRSLGELRGRVLVVASEFDALQVQSLGARLAELEMLRPEMGYLTIAAVGSGAVDAETLKKLGRMPLVIRNGNSLASLNHPNICTVHDVGPNYLVMELVEGETLAARLKGGPLPMDTALLYASQIAAALAEAHAKDIVHRDLKPGNIMIARSGIKVLDFGLAKSGQDQTVTASRMVMGTPGYMAPEQREGKPADARADIYSFGCVLYEMLTGARVALQRRRISSRKLEQIVSRCLEEDSGRRWHSVAELQQELGSITPARRGTRVGVAAAAILALSAVGAYFLLHRAPQLTDRDTIVLADFTNTTGNPVFDETLRQGLAVQLQQSPFLSLVSEERIRKELTLMQQPPDARLTSQLAQDVCVRTASAAVLDGSIANLGTQYVIALRARNCSNGDILADEQAQAARKEEVLGALSQIAIRFRTRVGESLATIEKYSMPLEEATTSSLEAWKAFSIASRAYQSGDASAALPLFKRAVAIDPDFAIAYARLGIHYSNVGEWTLARENTLKAYRLRDRASQVEQFWINTFYDRQVTGNLERQQQTMESWARTYPRDPTPLGLLAGTATVSTGKYELSIAAADRSLAIEPDRGSTYNSKANSQLSLNRLADAEDTIRRATERNLEFTNFLLVRYFIAFLNSDSEDMKRKAALAREKLALQDMISHIEALVLARSGRLQEARQTSAVAVDIAQKAGQRERAALFDAATAVWEAFYGHAVAARQKVTTTLDLARGRDVDYAAAFALAVSGDVSRSRALTDDLARNYPDDTSVQYMYLPTLRALFSLNAHDAAAAIQTVQTASRFDLGMGGIGTTGYFGRLYPIYVRGLAYLAAQQPAAAAAEFRRILDHRSIVLVDPMDAIARLQLARALVLLGDTAKAKRAYNDLFALWNDADPAIPIINEARAEYAKLQ